MAALTGCTSLQGTGDKGFVSGDGRVVEVPRDDREAPIELEGEDLYGGPVDLAALRGKPVVVTVWGSWCAPCRAEAEEVVSVAEEFDRRVEFVGINIRDGDVAQAQAFERRFDAPYPSVYSPGGEALLQFPGTLGPNSIPAFVVLDREGRVASSILGPLPSRTTLVELIEDAGAERADG